MCGDTAASARPSQTGAVAVIQTAIPPGQQARLLFHNPSGSDTAVTRMTCKCEDANFCRQLIASLELRIHRHGDLTAVEDEIASTYFISRAGQSDGAMLAWNEVDLASRLVLGVGGEGVIGRMISVMDGEEKVGDGILGWN